MGDELEMPWQKWGENGDGFEVKEREGRKSSAWLELNYEHALMLQPKENKRIK